MFSLGGPGIRGRGQRGNDQYTKLLLHCDGADASTTFTDSSASAHTVTVAGNAQIDTAQSVFGGASGLFDGTADELTVADHADFEIGAGEFTIDLRVRFNSIPAEGSGGAMTFMQKGTVGGSNLSFIFRLFDATVRKLNLIVSADGTTLNVNIGNAWTPSLNTWYHVAVVRTGTTVRMFIDGTQLGSDETVSTTFFSGSGIVGVGSNSVGANVIDGWIDEFRFSKEIARWTANFTPPSAPYF